MNDSLFSTKDMVKYIIVGGLVYAILKMIPSVQLANKDLMLLLAIITVGFVCLDCLFFKKSEGFANNDPFTLDLDTDVNELIKQRQAKRKESRKEMVSTSKTTPEEAEREKILSRLDEKRRKSSNPVEETKKEIKKLDEKISGAFSGADAEKARKAKVELEAKLEILKAKDLTVAEEERITQVREERASRPSRLVSREEKKAIMEEKLAVEEEQINAVRSKIAAEEKIVNLEERKSNAIKRGNSAELRALAEEIELTTKAKVIAEERVIVAEKRKETIAKKLADIPVSEAEERKLALEERVIADARLNIADELKAIAEKRGSTSELKQIIQEQKEAVVAKLDAEDRIAQVEDRKADRVSRMESEDRIAQVEDRKADRVSRMESEDRIVKVEDRIADRVARIESENIRGQVEERRAARVEIDERIKLPEQDDIEVENISRALPKTSCGLEVEKIKRQMQDEMAELKEQLRARSAIPPSSAKIANKYFESLMNDLADKGILDDTEIDNIQSKLRSKLLSMDEVIASLETLKKEGKAKVRVQDGKVKHDREYSELPSDFYTPIGQQVPNDWTSEYTILNTNKWQVPMPRPPVCINTQPCKVCPSDSSNYPVNLKQWDDSRYVTGGRINKKWADDQTSA